LITSGTAPYAGCYKPEQPLTTFDSSPAKGIWTFTAAVDLSSNIGTLTSWRLSLCVAPSNCGDGVVDAAELCDDGNPLNLDGCSATCTTEPGWSCGGSPTVCTAICGDGIVVAGELCDDGNPTPGDGCAPACTIESGYFCSGSPSACVPGDTEPNNTFAEADARALDPTPILITGNTLYGGAISPIGDKDIYKIVLAADAVVRFELFDSSAADCTGGITPLLRLYNAAQTQLYTDTVSGIASCSLITVNLLAGTYYVQVEENGNNALVPNYRLAVTLMSNQGSETEVNDTQAMSNALPGSNVYVFGGHQLNTDVDYFMIDVPVSGMSVHAETIEGGMETCESNGIDSRLTLFNAAGLQLSDDDDDGRGYCSKLDGTGSAPIDAGSHNLAAGTYFIAVRASSFAQSGVNGQFDYKLIVTVRAP
jgi:cysteine-rich repeat protein